MIIYTVQVKDKNGTDFRKRRHGKVFTSFGNAEAFLQESLPEIPWLKIVSWEVTEVNCEDYHDEDSHEKT